MKIGKIIKKYITVVIIIKQQLKESDTKIKYLNYSNKIRFLLLLSESFREYSYNVIIKIII